MRWSLKAAAAVAASVLVVGVGADAAMASTTTHRPHIVQTAPSKGDPQDEHAGQPGGPLVTGSVVKPNSVPVSGRICLNSSGNPVTGGNCWWESAVQLWYNMKNGVNEQSEMATVYSEYGGDFQDGWTDDDAWWGIAFQEAYNLYGVSNYHTKATNLWTYDTTTGWTTACGGSTLQHSGGPENGISRAALGELAYMIGNTGSADRAAAWIYQYLQGSDPNSFVSESVDGNCSADPQDTTDHPTIGLETEAWKVENETSSSGQAGSRASAVAKNPDPIYNGVMQELFDQYIG